MYENKSSNFKNSHIQYMLHPVVNGRQYDYATGNYFLLAILLS